MGLVEYLNQTRLDGNSQQGVNLEHGKQFKTVAGGYAEDQDGYETSQVGVGNVAPGGNAAKQNDGVGRDRDMTDVDVLCGPLLNYRRMDVDARRWFGSVLIVTRGGRWATERRRDMWMQLQSSDTKSGGANGVGAYKNGADNGGMDRRMGSRFGRKPVTGTQQDGTCQTLQATLLYSDPQNAFWRFDLQVPMMEQETMYEYSIPDLHFAVKGGGRSSFAVPAVGESMRMMFHSCNGFSVGTDEAAWSGPCLWNDVLRKHEEKRFHVM